MLIALFVFGLVAFVTLPLFNIADLLSSILIWYNLNSSSLPLSSITLPSIAQFCKTKWILIAIIGSIRKCTLSLGVRRTTTHTHMNTYVRPFTYQHSHQHTYTHITHALVELSTGTFDIRYFFFFLLVFTTQINASWMRWTMYLIDENMSLWWWTDHYSNELFTNVWNWFIVCV